MELTLAQRVRLGAVTLPKTHLETIESKLALSRTSSEDMELIVELSSLNISPRKNWVESAGGLPEPIRDLAVELIKKGFTRERAISTAVSRAKVFAVTVKDPAKKAKWVAAVAQWERMKKSRKKK